MKRFNILVDFVCSLGFVSRLLNTLKGVGFAPRLISYDTIRLRSIHLIGPESVEAVLNRVDELFSLIRGNKGVWKTCCLEVWAEITARGRGASSKRLIKVNRICVYTRRGSRGRVVYKLVWTPTCERVEGSIPESIGRKCVEDIESIDAIHSYVHDFVSYIAICNGEASKSSR